jgi:hypothetical protein
MIGRDAPARLPQQAERHGELLVAGYGLHGFEALCQVALAAQKCGCTDIPSPDLAAYAVSGCRHHV